MEAQKEETDPTRYGGFLFYGRSTRPKVKHSERTMAKGREGGPMLCPNSVLTGRTIDGEAFAERFAKLLICLGAQEGTRTPTTLIAST